ncbi:MAG: MFS transporter [Trueperaceae bacterium]|nr:MFS transporter [Trueperaceae bacterium]
MTTASGSAPAPNFDPSTHARHARRITRALFAVQSLGSAGSIGVATVAAIVGAELSGNASLAGAPAATYQVGVACAALLWGTVSDRIGRRPALTTGLLTGVVGSVAAIAAVVAGSFGLLLLGLVVMGSGTASVQLGRFAAAEVNPTARRARAVASVVLGGTVGSVLGPSLVAPLGRLADGFGWDALAGPYIGVLVAYLIAALVVTIALRPDPKTLGEALGREAGGPIAPTRARPFRAILRDPTVLTAIVTLVLAQGVMVGLMQMTSLHMREHAHTLAGISLVFSSHTFGMFAFSVVSGRLADRFGRPPVMVFGALIMIVSCLGAPLSPQIVPLAAALFGLGIGWNLCYVSGSALLSDALTPAEKGRIQGFNDLLVGGSAASGSLFGGMLFAAAGYGAMGVVGAILTAPILVVLVWHTRVRPARTSSRTH